MEEEAWQAILDDTSLEDLLMQHRKSHLAASATDVKVVGEVSQVISESEHINKGGSGQSDGIINVADAVTVTSSSETSPRCSKLRTDLRVSPSAEYVGIHLPDSKVDVTVICDEPNTATSESSRRLLASTDEPISSSSFLESSFLRDHLAEGGISPDRNSGDRPRSTFRFSASNTPVGDNSNTAFGFGHGSDSIKWKLQAPEVVRDRTVEERKQKARIVSHRAKVITEKQAVRLAKAEMKLDTRLRGAEQRHTEYVKAIKGRAGNENAKVSEVHFINTINEEHLVSELQQRLEEVEARILAAANRRSERLQDIAVQQKKRNHKKIQQMSELRLQLERQRMERWEKLQRRIEAVQNRREARLLEMKNLLSRRSVVSAEPSMSDPSPVPDKKLITDTDGAVTEGIVTINNSHHGCTDVKTLPHISSTDKFSPESTTSVTSLVTGNTTVNVKPPVARTTSAGRRQSTDGGMASVLKSTASSEAKKAKKADTTGSSKGSSQSNITSENNSKFTKKKAKVEQVDSNSSTLISASLVLKDNKIIDGASKDKNNECVDIDSKINTDRSQEDINVEKGNSNNESRDCTEGITSTECTPVKTKKTRPKKKKAKKAVIESINSETTIESVVNTESTEESNDPVDSFVAAYRSWQRNQALKDVVEARADLNNNHNRYDKDNITVHTESVFGNGKYPTATNFMVSNTSVLPSASDHSTSDNLSNKVNIHVTESVYQATLQSHVDQLRTLLLSHESVLRLSFIAFNSTAFRGTITGNAEANSDPELALRHLWTCVASILGSPHFRETVHFDRLWSFRLVELFLLLLDESHGILSSADRFKYAVTQPGLLFALSACFRSAVLLDGACAVLIDKHSYLLSRFIDLTSLLLYWTNQLPHDVSNESTQQESGQLRTQVLQSLSILLNALHFIPQYLSTPDFSFIPSSSSQKQQKQQEQRQEYEKQRLSQNKWNDSQSRLVWYMSSCHLLVGTIEYLNSFSIQFLQQQWSRQIFTTDNNMERIDPTYPTIELLQLDLRSYSSADKKTRMKSDEKLLGEYEMLCGGVELCWAIASYLRLSAGMSDSTVVHDIDQLRTRLRHRHTRGRQMLSLLADGPHSPLMAVSTHLLGVTYRIHKNDEIIPNKSDSFLSSVSKVDTTWSLPISSTTQSHVLSDSLSTILTLVTDTLCVLSEADIGLHRRLAKQTRMDLVTHLGALLAVTGSSVTQSALQTSVLRVLGLIYLSAPSEPMPTCNASVQLNDHILLVTRQEGLLLPSQVLTRLQEMLVASENITKDDDTVVNDINIVVNDSPWSKVGQAALIRAVLLNMLHSCDLLMPSTELTFSSNSISTASVNNIREYFQLRMQELKRQRQPLKPVISTTDCSSSHSLSQSILLLSHVAPVCLWTSQNLESNQVM